MRDAEDVLEVSEDVTCCAASVEIFDDEAGSDLRLRARLERDLL